MEITGRIIAVLEKRCGTAKSGNAYAAQEYVIEDNSGQYPRKMCFEVFGEEKINEFSIRQGAEYRVSFDINAREWNGRYFNSIRAWKVTPLQPTQSVSPQPQMQVFPPSAPAAPEQAKTDGDDLPF